MFADKRAIWIENGKLVHLHQWCLAANCNDIKDISAGTFGIFKVKAIIIGMRDGRRKLIPTALLSESGGLIIARIRKVLSSGGE
jgi:hypothetical protein